MKKVLFLFLIINCQLSIVNQIHAQRTITTERVEVTNRLDAHPDAAALTIMERYKPAVDSVMAPVLGESLVGMSAARPESLLSNWAADVMVEFSDFLDGKRADLGLVNVGGLRNNMPQGTVRRGDIILISPFDNRLAIVFLKGSDLTELMRNIAVRYGEGVSHEVRLTITKEGELVDAQVGGKPIDPEKTYRVATLDYLCEGNDGMTALKKASRMEVSQLYTRDCMMRSIERHKKITSAIEGRITVKD